MKALVKKESIEWEKSLERCNGLTQLVGGWDGPDWDG
jgi:hypothetical protein